MHRQDLDENDIFSIHDFLSPQECENFIAAGERMGFADAPINSYSGVVVDKDVRNNARVMIDDPPLASFLWERAGPLLPPQIGGWEAVGVNERFRYYRYEVGERFAPHYDGAFYRQNGEQSVLTFMMYLNDGFEGGETKFHLPTGMLTVQPVSGLALFFVHHRLHEGAPVVQGRKYVLRTDVMYRRKKS